MSAPAQERVKLRSLLLLLLAALFLRCLFYTGFFGSDEVTYLGSAIRWLNGDLRVDPYVGANRYGINLPMAASLGLFGRHEAAAALYAILASVAEVGLLAGLGAALFGARQALAAAWLLALTPMHIHLAGRLLADPPMALAVTASFLFFFRGQLLRERWAFLLAGLAAGWAFWIKPVGMFYLGVFLLVPLLTRRWDWRWMQMLMGLLIMVGLNCLFFGWLSGDALYLFRAMADRHDSGHLAEAFAAGRKTDAAGYYLSYLFFKGYHTALLGPLALIGLWLTRRGGPEVPALRLWLIGLLILLSLLPVSLSPLTLVPKQTNYMTMFLAPLALAAAPAVLALGRWLWLPIASLTLLLAALLQNDVAVFTANSHALVALARQHPEQPIWTGTNAYRAARFDAALNGKMDQVRSLDEWRPGQHGWVWLDPQTLAWGKRERWRSEQELPACWRLLERRGAEAAGVGPALLRALTGLLPATWSERGERLLTPKPALLLTTEAC